MPILPNEPITVPEKNFDKLWSCKIEITAPAPGGEASAKILLLPYNDTGDTCPEKIEVLDIESIMAKAQDPETNIAKAMYFLLAAINDEYVAQKTLEPQPEGEQV